MAQRRNIDLQELLVRPREALDIEIKGWLDLSVANQRADLTKAIIALANHGGGYVVIGLAESGEGQFSPDTNRPRDLSGLTQDAVQDAIQKYLDPVIQCRVDHIEHPVAKGHFPIVVVPGNHRSPIRAKAASPDGKLAIHRIYVRRPGPRSEEPQNSAEWDRLLEQCVRARKDELLEAIRDLLSGEAPRSVPTTQTLSSELNEFIKHAESRWSERIKAVPPNASPRFPHGSYSAAFAIEGPFQRPKPNELRDAIRSSLKSYSGWSPFPFIERPEFKPALIDNAIEAWLGPDHEGNFDTPAHSDFWRISPDGFLYLKKGFDEDGRYKNIEPGLTFDITTATWRIGEIFLEIFHLATALGASDSNLLYKISWEKLDGRHLVSTGNPNRILSGMKYSARQANYNAEGIVPVNRIYDNLPEILFKILEPLYQLFDFWRLPKRLVEEELRQLRRD